MNAKITLSTMSLLLLFSWSYAQKKISGITIEETYKLDGKKLVLNGAGVREKFFMDLYVAGLYTENKSQDANKIIDANEPIVMKISIISDLITKEKMESTINEGFKKSTKGNLKPYQSRIDEFVKEISQDIKKGAKYDIIYNPTTSTTKLFKDGALKSEIKGLDFKKVLFGIWLGPDPADDDLKKDLLGK